MKRYIFITITEVILLILGVTTAVVMFEMEFVVLPIENRVSIGRVSVNAAGYTPELSGINHKENVKKIFGYYSNICVTNVNCSAVSRCLVVYYLTAMEYRRASYKSHCTAIGCAVARD
jgi:hypothetical protein